MLSDYGVGEDWEPLDCKEIQPVHPKRNQSSVFIGRTDVETETPILWPPDGRTDVFEKTLMLGKIEGGRTGDDRGWDSWMASPTQWTWVWVNSGHWWWTGRPGMLQCMELQRVRQDWATELNWTDAESPILWPPDTESQLIGRDPDVGKDWRQKEKREAEDCLISCIINSKDMNLSNLWGIVKDRGAWHAVICGIARSRTLPSDWTTTITIPKEVKSS